MEPGIDEVTYFFDWDHFEVFALTNIGTECFVPSLTLQNEKFVFTLKRPSENRVWIFKGPCTKQNFDRIFKLQAVLTGHIHGLHDLE